MNLVIIGGKNPEKMAETLYKTFDDVKILSYANIRGFLDAISLRAIDVHRLLMLQDGLEYEEDNIVDRFIDTIQKVYPAVKVITLSREPSWSKYFYQFFGGLDGGHFCITSVKAKMLADFVSLPVGKLIEKYSNFAYKESTNVSTEDTDIIEENNIEGEEIFTDDNVDGYIPPPEEEEDGKDNRNIFEKLMGKAPKSKGKLTKKNGMQEIGQGVGVKEFSQEIQPVDFGEETEQHDFDTDELDVNVFLGDSDLGLGVDVNPYSDSNFEEAQEIMDKYSEMDDIQEEIITETTEEREPIVVPSDFLTKKEEVYNEYESEETVVVIDSEENSEEEEVSNFVIEENNESVVVEDEIEIPDNNTESFENLKKSVNEAKLNTDIDMPNMTLETMDKLDEVDDSEENMELFAGNMDNLMQQFEEASKPEPKVIIKEVMVPGPSQPQVVVRNSKFRNKNGIRVLIVTGDRRIGCTKLSLNLSSMFTKTDKVLYVDFDRNRHGSLGYLDIEGIFNEPEHIQNGLEHLKTVNVLPNVVHTYTKGKFYTLTSMYGNYITDKQMKEAQAVLLQQREFTTVVIDCPLEDLYLLNDILYTSNVLICAEDNRVGVLNLITGLAQCRGSEKFKATLFDRSSFIVGRGCNINKFTNELNYVCNDLFEGTAGDWPRADILGTIKNVQELDWKLGDNV